MTRRLLVLSLLLAGCETESDSAASHLPPVCAPDDAACDPYDQLHLLGTWSQALCRFLLDCCAPADRLGTAEMLLGADDLELMLLTEPALLSDGDACLVAMHRALQVSMEDDWVAVAAGRRRYQREAGAACLEGLVTGSEACVPGLVLVTDPFLPPSCAEMVVPAVERGGPCYASGDCVPWPDQGPSTCFNASSIGQNGALLSLAGTCEPLPAQGEACALPGGECEAGAYCQPLVGACAPRAGIGQSCAGRSCIEGSFCSPQTFACVPLGATGAPCAADDQCAAGDCSPELSICMPSSAVDPMTVEYTFCLGEGENGRLADYLPGDGRTGGD